jgi:hypothetical protein
MIIYNDSSIKNVVVHKVGNNKEANVLSSKELEYDIENYHSLLKNFLLKGFTTQIETFRFTHPVDIQLNPVLKCCTDIFQSKNFIKASSDIVKYLVESSRHPNIKAGEIFIASLDEVLLDDTFYEAITIIKTENRESYFDDYSKGKTFEIEIKSGISSNKFDKGCLVLNSSAEEGFILLIVDNNTKETEYWKTVFLNVASRNDNNSATNNYLLLAKDFVTKQLNEDFEVTSADKADYLNKSVEYFKKNDHFDQKEFVEEVFKHNEVINSFELFKKNYQQAHDISLSEDFDISQQVVKKQARIFKSVLKLDKNFHIYIHGDKELIEKGFDEEKKMNYYKVYFKDEQ